MKLRNVIAVWFAATVVAIFIFLFMQSQRINEELHSQYTSELRQLEGLHAVLNEDVLRVRLGLLSYLDPLNTTLSDLDIVRDRLGQLPAYIDEQGREAITGLLLDYDEFMASKRALVEDFISQNAVLRNSLSYFTIVVSDLAGRTSEENIPPELRSNLSALLQDILLYDVTTQPELVSPIRENVELLVASQNETTVPVTALPVDMDALARHTDIILENKPSTDALLDEIVALPISQQIAAVSNLYQGYYEAARQSVSFYQIALYVFSLVVVGYVAITIILKLRRSAAILSTAKQELEIANQQEQLATNEAREASRLKDEFLAIMSHELRTPLNAIIGFQGILLMTANLEERAAHMLRRAEANAERLLELINDILDISRIESGRIQLAPDDISVKFIVEKWQSQMSILAEEKGIKFSVHIDPSMPAMIHADEDAITKIVTNLLSNAFKFTEQGEVTLGLKRSNGSCIIEVKDTGIGIPAHMHQIIFERFRQVDGSSKRKYGGSGLGLAIVHHLCMVMDGTVTVESLPGEGSTFTAVLPMPEAGGHS